MKAPKPNDTSGDYKAMALYWSKVTAIMGGTDAIRKQTKYLPKFAAETEKDYEFRRENAKFTNVYRDIVENLAQRPFAKQVALEEGSPRLIEFSEDVDGAGNNLHVFAASAFFDGIAYASTWILVDYTPGVPAGATVADERAAGARPYWVSIPAESLLAVYTDMVDGQEQVVHARIAEPETVRDGFGETTIERVRVFDRAVVDGSYGPPTWQVYEKEKNAQGGEDWVALQDPQTLTIGVIPLVPFITGRRKGSGWCVYPPMQDAADLQIELFQQESNLKHAAAMTAFPVFCGNGVDPERDDENNAMPIEIGPGRVLYTGSSPDGNPAWGIIEPGAQSLTFLAEQIKETIRELRELGRQPLTAQSGNLTVVTTAFAAQKGNAAIQAWALLLKDALENALRLTALWLAVEEDPSVSIDTEFDLGFGDDASFGHVLAMKQSGDISRKATISEAKRRAILSEDYDPDEDLDEILSDVAGDDLLVDEAGPNGRNGVDTP